MPAQTSPPPGAARPLPPPSASGSAPSPPGAARPHRPVLRTRISGIRTALIAGALLMAAAGTARITQLRRAIRRTRRGQPPAPAAPGGRATAPGRKEQRPC
jgi:hypothetical protein